MRWIDILYGIIIIGALSIFILVINHFSNILKSNYGFIYTFIGSTMLLILSIHLINSYLNSINILTVEDYHTRLKKKLNLHARYYELTSLIFATGAFLFLIFLDNNYLTTSLCCVISIYYLVKFIKTEGKKIKNGIRIHHKL